MLREVTEKISKSKSRTFLMFCFCFISGTAIFSTNIESSVNKLFLYGLMFLVLFFLILCWNNYTSKIFILSILFFILGGLRFYWSVPGVNLGVVNYYNGQNLNFVGVITKEVVEKENSTQAVVTVNTVGNKKVSGKVLLYLPPYADLKFGDYVQVSCQLKKPIGSDSFVNYDKYLARDGIWSQCNWPKIIKLPHKFSLTEKIMNNFYNFKQVVQQQVNELWSEPQSSLMAGLLYGARAGFSQEINDSFNRAGITHIVAISGYNINVVASVMMSVLLLAGLNRKRAFWLAVFGIIIFVLFTGASASVVRAGIMGIIVLLATQLGRLSRIGNILVFTAAIMLLFNPFVLIWDAGFQLSFLSTIGLIYLSPILIGYFNLEDKNIFIKNLIENFITTISAIIITLPLILFQFGRLSVIAPLANLLIVWIVPYLMLFGFAALILSVFIYPFGQLVAWVANLGLKYVIIMSHSLASWSLASVSFSINIWQTVVLYGLIIFYIYKYAKNKNSKFN